MKNIILFILINLGFIGYAYSQKGPKYVYDNFDTSKGVQVVITQKPFPPSPKTNKQAVKKTEKKTEISVNSNLRNNPQLNLRNNPQPNVKLINKTVMYGGRTLGEFTTGDFMIDSYIVESSSRYGVDPLLIYSQMNQESAFKLRATSNKGARGLMQLMPATAARFGVTDIYDPRQNIDAGVRYMRWLLDTFGGNLNLALAGYNAGEGAVMKYGNQIPPYNETQEYVRRISARYNYIKSIKKMTAPKTVKRSF